MHLINTTSLPVFYIVAIVFFSECCTCRHPDSPSFFSLTTASTLGSLRDRELQRNVYAPTTVAAASKRVSRKVIVLPTHSYQHAAVGNLIDVASRHAET